MPLTNVDSLYLNTCWLHCNVTMVIIVYRVEYELSGQTVKSISSKMLAWGFLCKIHSQHSENGGRQDRMEEKRRYHCQYHHTYIPPPLAPQLVQSKRWGGRKKGGRTPETQSHSHSCSFTSRLVIRGITSSMQGLKVNKSAVNGNNFDTEVVYLVSVIRVISWLLNSLLSSIPTIITTVLALLPYYYYYLILYYYYCMHDLYHGHGKCCGLSHRTSGPAASHHEKSKKID